MIDQTTQRWIRNPSDEKAAAGCSFDTERAAHTVYWIEKYCKLYEGEFAGEPLILHGCAECDYGLPDLTESRWNEKSMKVALERAERHLACFEVGHRLDWQYECVMRLFGWVKYSERWKRKIRRFREAFILVGKKNKKTPSVSAIALYLMCGDGEQGGKVFLAAKDGNQARELAGKHVIEMVMRSPALNAECTINQSTKQVTHERSRSLIRPLSSSNERTQQAKEGLNGSVIIDEVHVCDRDYVARISRAGISRSEPLQIEISTAGNDPDGYGKERFDYALAVQNGEREDQALFAAIYAAPQNLADADLEADPLKYGRLANPAFGHTVEEEEYLLDYHKSKVSLSKLADFKMYRLNIWQLCANPWLNMDHWAACYEDFGEEELMGQECFAGLDLAKVYDTTALALIFPQGEDRFRQLVYYWLPRETAEKMNHVVPYLQWARDGWITLTDGATTDYNFVRREINDARSKFVVRRIAFDGTYAEQLMQRIVEEDGMDIGVLAKFPQTIMGFAKPTSDYERFVIDGNLRHNGNPVLTWQAKNTKVWTDANQNKRPVKPKPGSHLTIDGVCAGIMALTPAMAVDSEDWYRPGILTN